MNKNDILKLKIENYGTNGEGVAKVENMAVFVPFAMRGEIVSVKIILKKKHYAIGKLIEVIEPSSERVEPFCPYYRKCGGCQIQHLSQDEQKKYKKEKIEQNFNRIAFLPVISNDTVQGEHTKRYRNKLQLPLTEKDGKLIGGFYAANSHRIVEIDDCKLQNELCINIITALKEYAQIYNIKGYNENKNDGVLRHLIIRKNDNAALITIVINATILPNADKLYELMTKKINISFGLYININKKRTNVITGTKYIHIDGLKKLNYCTNGINYSITPQSFLQVNDEISAKIYTDAIEKASISPQDIVVNAYSGAGLLTAYFAKAAKHTYGIEIIPEATESANELAKTNGLNEKMTNITGDCKEVLLKLIPKLRKELKVKNNAEGKIIFVLDPPRKGVDQSILLALKKLLPDKIIYISCNPATLARDVGILCNSLEIEKNNLKKSSKITAQASKEFASSISNIEDDLTKRLTEVNSNFSISTLTPYDMFPQTHHVETLIVLEKN